MDAVGVEPAGGDDFLDLDHADLAAGRRGGVEIARGFAEHDIAGLVGLPCLDDGEVGEDAMLEDVILSGE